MKRRRAILGLLVLPLTWLAWPVSYEPREGLVEVPLALEQAFLAAEDHRFRAHPGVDPVAIGRAARENLRAGQVVEGGSTVTQQLVRTMWERPSGLSGKAWEAAWALRVEAHLSKDEVLLEYLNRVYLGGQRFGVTDAARELFDREPENLSVAQMALLAALPAAPARRDPIRHPEVAVAERNRVLDRMESLGWLVDADLARDEPMELRAPPEPVQRHAPGSDAWLQGTIDALVAEQLEALDGRADHAAVVVMKLRTEEVLARVGSGDWDAPDGQVDGTRAARSPGSALKPFVYQLALEKGWRMEDVVEDAPGDWSTSHGTWSPRNYDDRFWGPMSLAKALGNSRNLPAVRLLESVGVATLHRRLQDAGLTTLDERPAHYGLGLSLGDGEVRLDELTAAYARLARGEIGEAWAAWEVIQVLDDPDARAAAFGVDSVLEPAFPLAVKTGTSVGWRDNWAMGVTPEVAIGVWVGNFDGEPMHDVGGVTGAGPLLRAVAEAAHTGRRQAFKPGPPVPERTSMQAGPCWADPCLVQPGDGTVWWSEGGPEGVPLRAALREGVAEFLVDGVTVARVEAPYEARWTPERGEHRVSLQVDGVEVAVAHITVGGL